MELILGLLAVIATLLGTIFGGNKLRQRKQEKQRIRDELLSIDRETRHAEEKVELRRTNPNERDRVRDKYQRD